MTQHEEDQLLVSSVVQCKFYYADSLQTEVLTLRLERFHQLFTSLRSTSVPSLEIEVMFCLERTIVCCCIHSTSVS